MSNGYEEVRDEILAKLSSFISDNGPDKDVLSNYSELFKGLLNDEINNLAPKDNGNYDLLSKAFEGLGDKFISLAGKKNGKISEILKLYTDSLLYYQYAIQICQNYQISEANILNIKSKIGTLYKNFISYINPDHSDFEIDISHENWLEVISHKSEIKGLRAISHDMLSSIQDIKVTDKKSKIEYVEKSNQLLNFASKGIKDFLGNIIADAEKACGEAPCKYSVIGLGSLSLKQVTPYSDLEYAFLLEKDSAEIQEYFSKLGYYVNFAVTALGESVIPTSTFGIALDQLVKKAVNLDLGGKVSLGRADKDYSLVCTIEGMLKNMKGEHNAEVSAIDDKRVDSKLPFVLTTTCHISGDDSLTKEYQAKTNEFLLSQSGRGDLTNAQTRAIEVLSEETNTRKANLDEFRFKSEGMEGKLFNVKEEIYRIPDRMIYNLGLIYNHLQTDEGMSANDIINQLEISDQISSDSALNLKFASAFANILRYRVYSHYEEQKENIDPILFVGKRDRSHFQMRKEEIEFVSEEDEKQGVLLQYYFSMIPLIEKLVKLCDIAEETDGFPEGFFKEETFYDVSFKVKADISMRLMNFENVIKFTEALISMPYDDADEDILLSRAAAYNQMGTVLYYQGKYSEAVEIHKAALEMEEKVYQGPHSNLAATYARIGRALLPQNKYKEALEFHELSLKIQKILLGEKSHAVAASYSNIAAVYNSIKLYDKSLNYLNLALEIMISEKGENHFLLGVLYNNIARIYTSQGNLKSALISNKKALEIYKKNIAEKHITAAASYDNTGVVLQDLGEYNEALQYFKIALEIRVTSLGENHYDTLATYYHISEVLSNQEKYEESLEIHKKIIKILKVIGNDSVSLAIAYHKKAVVLKSLFRYDDSVEYYTKSAEVYKSVVGEECRDFASVQGNIANILLIQGKHSEALKHSIIAHKIFLNLFPENHPDVATSHHNIGNVFRKLKMSDKALESYKKAIEIFKNTVGEEYRDIAVACVNISSIYKSEKIYDKALEYSLKAFNVLKKLSHTNSIDIAKTYASIAEIFDDLGEFSTSLKLYQSELKVREEASYSNKSDIIKSLENIAASYFFQGIYDNALRIKTKQLLEIEALYGVQSQNYLQCQNEYKQFQDAQAKYEIAIKEFHNGEACYNRGYKVVLKKSTKLAHEKKYSFRDAEKFYMSALKKFQEINCDTYIQNAIESLVQLYGITQNDTEKVKYNQMLQQMETKKIQSREFVSRFEKALLDNPTGEDSLDITKLVLEDYSSAGFQIEMDIVGDS